MILMRLPWLVYRSEFHFSSFSLSLRLEGGGCQDDQPEGNVKSPTALLTFALIEAIRGTSHPRRATLAVGLYGSKIKRSL